MSYILEALKKSDEERNRGTAPGLQTVQSPVVHAPEKRTGWRYLLLFALLLNAGLLTWWLGPWKMTNPRTVQSNEQQQSQPVVAQTGKGPDSYPARAPGKSDTAVEPAVKPSPPTEHKRRLARIQPTPSNPADSLTEPVSKAGAPVQAAPAPDQQPAQPARPAVKGPSAGAREAKITPTAVEQVKEKESKPAPAAPIKPAAKPEAVAAAPPSPAIEQLAKVMDQPAAGKPEPTKVAPKAAGAESAEDKQLPNLKTLPTAIRKEIPAITLSLLVYSNNPTDRMVNINGQMTREGQEVVPGLVLEQITREGAVFNYKGTRFQKGAF